MKYKYQLKAFLVLNSAVRLTPFNPDRLISIYTANWRCCHVMNSLQYKTKHNSNLGRENYWKLIAQVYK